jgi:hypothetical protein
LNGTERIGTEAPIGDKWKKPFVAALLQKIAVPLMRTRAQAVQERSVEEG